MIIRKLLLILLLVSITTNCAQFRDVTLSSEQATRAIKVCSNNEGLTDIILTDGPMLLSYITVRCNNGAEFKLKVKDNGR